MFGGNQPLHLRSKTETTVIKSCEVTLAFGIVLDRGYDSIVGGVSPQRLLFGVVGGIEVELALPPWDLYLLVVGCYANQCRLSQPAAFSHSLSILFAGNLQRS